MSGGLGIEVILKDKNSLDYSYEDIIMFRCRTCCKFIKKHWGKWYCPHCSKSFVEGMTKEEIEDMDELMSYMDDIKDIGGW